MKVSVSFGTATYMLAAGYSTHLFNLEKYVSHEIDKQPQVSYNTLNKAVGR